MNFLGEFVLRIVFGNFFWNFFTYNLLTIASFRIGVPWILLLYFFRKEYLFLCGMAADEMSYSESHVNKVCNLHISGLLTAAKCTNVCWRIFFSLLLFFIHGYSFMGVHILSTH